MRIFLILLLVAISCKGKESGNITPDAAANKSATAGSAGSSLSDETANTPTIVTGAFLACDYVVKPATATTKATIGCRMADQKTGHKYDLTKLPEYDWGFDQLANIKVNMAKSASSSAPWQVTYELSGDTNNLQGIGDKFKIGLKNVVNLSTYYQKIDNLVGRLNFLMEGTWQANKCLLRDDGGAKRYYVRTDIMTAGIYTTVEDYYLDAECTGTPDWTETITGLVVKVTFDGTNFYLDNRTDDYSILPRSSGAIPVLNTICGDLSFQVGSTIDTINCIASAMEYTTMRFDENAVPERIYTALANADYDGTIAQKRKQDIVTDWYLVKQ